MQDSFDDSEQVLVLRAINEPAAFQHLYERYFSRIYRYVASRINNQHDAEDVVSDIFLRLIQNLPQLRNQHSISFAAWLFVIARNAVTDHYRRRPHTETLIPLDAVPPTSAMESDPVATLIEGEDAAQIRRLIAALPERKREVVMLRYYGGLRNQEIAVVLQIGEKTVAAYLSRALDELHEKYTALKSEPEHKVVGHDS
jgi:RNA polymerase sigma factor (sigma-70 family)